MDAQPGAFVRHHQLVNRQAMRLRDFQQLRGTVEGIWQPCFLLTRECRLRTILDNEPATNRKIRALFDSIPDPVKRGQSQTVRMLRARSRRKHGLAFEMQVSRLIKSDTAHPREIQHLLRADLRHRRFNCCRIDRRRLIPRQPQQHRSIRTVSHSGQGKRAVKLRLHAAYLLKFAFRLELACKAARRAHRTHRMRTRRSNAKLVKIEKTRRHAEDCIPCDEWQSDCLYVKVQIEDVPRRTSPAPARI